LKDGKIEILITVDCGIRDNEAVDFANKCGMEVIITDHHDPDDSLPVAV